MMRKKLNHVFTILGLLVVLAACGSIAKGVTEAILANSEEKETRQCHIEGQSSGGLAKLLEVQAQGSMNSPRELKILMVHGIGRHSPRYSGRLVERLMPALGLTVRSETAKEVVLWEEDVSDKPVGRLSVQLFMNPEKTRRLAFYELTWSEVFDEERRSLDFDSSTKYAQRRTRINDSLKSFFNNHVPDAFIYMSSAREKVFASVQQSFCWMTSGNWADLPAETNRRCHSANMDRVEIARNNDFAFVTHSLGSRIVVDVLQDETGLVRRSEEQVSQPIAKIFRDREIPIFMLSNQLPLLGLGIPPPAKQQQSNAYCARQGALAHQRAVKQLSIYAFTDPNDLLSYPIPPEFLHDYVDSRLCPAVTNISINVAQAVDFFGVSGVANPVSAHGNYDQDDRVIEIIAHGIGHANKTSLIVEKCSWVETVKDT
jgi:hypothetical protein